MLALCFRACYCAVQHSSGFEMKSQDLPQDTSPLSPWEYWRESLTAWSDFSQRAATIMTGQMGKSGANSGRKLDPDADTLASELLRTLSDFNLRHWQNTARLLESYPSWMQVPHNMTGSALVDWYDNLQRSGLFAVYDVPKATRTSTPERVDPAAPDTVPAPVGAADDLTRIKGIGPKRSVQLNALGIYHFSQIAAWSEAEARWVDEQLASPGRARRDDWISQARRLSANGSATHH